MRGENSGGKSRHNPGNKSGAKLSRDWEPEQARIIMDALSAHVAIVDQDGLILDTNRAWREFARENGLHLPPDTLHLNYPEICVRAATSGDNKADKDFRGQTSTNAPRGKNYLPTH